MSILKFPGPKAQGHTPAPAVADAVYFTPEEFKALIAAGDLVPEPDLVGVYKCRNGKYDAFLEMPDGRFMQVAAPNDKVTLQ